MIESAYSLKTKSVQMSSRAENPAIALVPVLSMWFCLILTASTQSVDASSAASGADPGGEIEKLVVTAQQVEVRKAPQSTSLGRNATGGLVRVTTNDPSHTFRGTVSARCGDYGCDSYFRVTGGLAQTPAADFALHLLHQDVGYGERVVTGSWARQSAQRRWSSNPPRS